MAPNKMTSRSKLVKRGKEVTEIEEDEKTFPFDDMDSTSVEDPLAIRTDEDDDLNNDEAEMKTVKQEVDDCDGHKGRRQIGNSGKLVKVFIKVESASKKTRKSGSGRPRKYATPEERRQAKAEQRLLRRAQMNEEAREELLRKRRESNRRRRAGMKAEKKEEILRKQRESSRKRWAEMKEEKRGEALQKMREEGHRRRAEIKEEAGTRVLNAETVENNSRNEPNDPHQTAEDSQPKRKLSRFEELREKQREYAKRRRANHEKHEEEKKKRREATKRLKEENPEEYAIRRAMVNQKRREQRKANAASQTKKPQKEETEEEREMRIMRNKQRYRKSRETPEARETIRFRQYSRIQMQIAQMTDEELEAFKAKRREYAKKFYDTLSGEKLEKYRTIWRNTTKKYHEKRFKNDAGEEYAYRDIFNARYRQRVANETPEQRQKRLRRYKINQAITKLRKQLEEIGVPPEEIEKRVTELKRMMQAEPLPPPETLSTYKPRVKSDINFNIPARPTDGRRRGRPTGSSRKIDSNSEAPCLSQSQPGMVSSEMDNSNDFENAELHWDTVYDDDDDANEENITDPNHVTTTTEPEPVPILRFDIKCPHCPSTYSERSDLISHVSSEHFEICWKCPKCKLIVLSSDELKDHYKTVHLQIPNRSTDTTTTASKPISKEISSIKGYNFSCMKCDPVKSPQFEDVKDLMAHVKSTHPKSFWPCSKCNILKYTESALKVHKNFCKRLEKSVKPNGQKNFVKK